jgi:hypothetical protein
MIYNQCYNPYTGSKSIRDMKKKSEKVNKENMEKHRRDISLNPKHILEDMNDSMKSIMDADFSIDKLKDTRVMKGFGVILIMLGALLYLFSFLS